MKLKKAIKTITNKIKGCKITKEKLKENYLFFLVVFGLTLNDLILRGLTIGNHLEFQPFLGSFAFVLLISSFGFLVKDKKRRLYYGTIIVLSLTINISNSLYFSFYSSFLSVSLISTSAQWLDVSDTVGEVLFNARDIVYLWLFVAFILLNYKFKKRSYNKKIIKEEFFSYFTLSVLLIVVFTLTLSGLEISRLTKQWNREYIVTKFGIYIYQANDVIRSIEPKINTLFGYDKGIQNVKEYYENREVNNEKNKYTNIFEGKNVIMIHAESIQTFLMDLKFNDMEVTPNLNRLAKEGIFFSNFYSQVGIGTSSDTEFTLSTSLLPAKDGTVFISYWDREYSAIPKLLKDKGYSTFSMHGNNGTFWNRLVMHEKLGYDKMYHKVNYEIDEEIGLGLSDRSFFRQSVEIIKKEKEKNDKFYSTLIMLSNHTPFSELDKYGEFDLSIKTKITNIDGVEEEVIRPYMEDTLLGNYIKASHYADTTIGEFISNLEVQGLLDNTVVVIYGDHDARLARKEYNRLYNYNAETDTVLTKDDPGYKNIDYYFYELNRKVPLIIWTKEKKYETKVDKVMGMIDVLPTLGNMLGIKSEYSLGIDVFNEEDNCVIFNNGNWLTNKVYYNSQKQEYLPLTTESLSIDYIEKNSERTEKLMSISNDLILYDYIKYVNNSGKVKEGTK